MARLAALLALTACWSSRSAPPPAEPAPIANTQSDAPPPLREQDETAIGALERFTNEMCQCSTSECATQVSTDLTTWAQAFSRDNPDGTRELGEEEQKRATELATRMGECMMKAMTSSSSSSPTGSAPPP